MRESSVPVKEMATGEGGPNATDHPDVKWSTYSGKYDYTASGTKDILLIVPNRLSVPAEAVPRRQRQGLTDQEAVKLENQGVAKEHQVDDTSVMRARYSLDEECSVVDEMFGLITCDAIVQRISTVFKSTNKAAVVLHYLGPGKKHTGDWCFQDGFITFKDIVKIFMNNKQSKGQNIILSIVSDCSYSGNWVRQCMNFMDEQGIGPCGHAAKERGILMQVIASCLPNEIPAEFTLSTWSFHNDKNTGMVGISAGFRGTKIYDDQHPSIIDFTQVRCGKDINSPCTMAPGSNWSKWSIRQRIVLVRNSNNAYIKWSYILLVDDDKVICDIALDRTISENLDDYGQVLMSAWGDELPKELGERLEMQYSINYDHKLN